MPAAQDGKPTGPDSEVLGYCVHCRSHRTMQGVIQVRTQRGGRALKGHCAVCGKPMYRLGGWDTVGAAKASNSEKSATESDASLSS